MYVFPPLTPDLDGQITPQERQAVQRLVDDEMAARPPVGLHPQVNQLLPELSMRLPGTLDADVDNEEYPEHRENLEDPMSRYSEFENRAQAHTALSYAILRERAALGDAEMEGSLRRQQRQYEALLAKVEELYHSELLKKRARLQEALDERSKRQREWLPVADHLVLRWHESIRSMVDVALSNVGDSAGDSR